jgi:hypothetical protein
MNKFGASSIALVLAAGITCSANAADKAKNTTDNTAAEAANAGTTSTPSASPPQDRHHGRHMREGHMPREHMVMSISTLSADQKTKISAIYSSLRSDLAPLTQQMRSLRDSAQTAQDAPAAKSGTSAKQGTGKADATATKAASAADSQQTIAQMQSVKKQINAKRTEAWGKVKALLSEAQMQEFEQILNAPRASGGGERHHHRHGGGDNAMEGGAEAAD